MPLTAGFLQHVAHAGLDAHVGFLADAERHRQPVGGQKADAPHIERQSVRILAHAFDSLGAVALVDPDRERGRDAVALQKHHHLTLAALFRPGLLDGERARAADARNLADAVGARVEDLQGLFAKPFHDAIGELGADALDKPSAQVAPDAIHGTWRELGVRNNAKLPAEAWVLFIVPGRAQMRASRQPEQVPHHGDRIGLFPDLEARHREFAAAAREHDPFDGALQGFVGVPVGTLILLALEEVHGPLQPPLPRRQRQAEA